MDNFILKLKTLSQYCIHPETLFFSYVLNYNIIHKKKQYYFIESMTDKSLSL